MRIFDTRIFLFFDKDESSHESISIPNPEQGLGRYQVSLLPIFLQYPSQRFYKNKHGD